MWISKKTWKMYMDTERKYFDLLARFQRKRVSKKITETVLYADNEIAEVVVEFSLNARDWYELQKLPCYRQLLEFLQESGGGEE